VAGQPLAAMGGWALQNNMQTMQWPAAASSPAIPARAGPNTMPALPLPKKHMWNPNIPLNTSIHLKIEINKKNYLNFNKKKKESGTVDFEEFINMMSKFRKVKSSKELEDELKEIFNVSDFFLF
jgi:hypothetical protein